MYGNSVMPLRLSLWAVVAVALVASACAGATPAGEPSDEIRTYFAEFADAWASGDPYDIARFYDSEVVVREVHPDLELTNPAGYADTTSNGVGRAWLARWLSGRRGEHPTTLGGLFVGSSGAVPLLVIEDLGAAVLLDIEMGPVGVTHQVTLRWRDAKKDGGAPDERLVAVDQLVDDYVAGWSAGSADLLEELYTAEAVLERFVHSQIEGRDGVMASLDRLALPEALVTEVSAGSQSGPAVFVLAGAKPETIAFVIEHARGDGCVTQSLIMLGLDDNRIATEQRLPDITSAERCHSARLSALGWWTGLTTPLALEDQVTSELTVPGGSTIQIVNGGANLDQLALWGFDRFATTGLNPPRIETITFAPVPACANVAGVISESTDGPPDLVLCTDAHQACLSSPNSCVEFALSARLGLLHEMAHVWLLQNMTDEQRGQYLDRTGFSVWRDTGTPWHLRGVENAAETLAWGLIDEPVPLARLGNPTCESLSAGFALLTGATPDVNCAEAP